MPNAKLPRRTILLLPLALAGLIVSLIYAFFLSNGAQVMGEAMYMQAVILIGCVFFVWYAQWATKRGLLR